MRSLAISRGQSVRTMIGVHTTDWSQSNRTTTTIFYFDSAEEAYAFSTRLQKNSKMLAMSTLMMPAATMTTMTNPGPIPVAAQGKLEPAKLLQLHPGLVPPLQPPPCQQLPPNNNKSGESRFNFTTPRNGGRLILELGLLQRSTGVVALWYYPLYCQQCTVASL